MSFHFARRRFLVAGDLRDREGRAGPRRPHLTARRSTSRSTFSITTGSTSPTGVPPQPPSANDAASAEHQQAAAALVDEVGEHAQLLGRERRRFDAAENDARGYSNSSSRVFGKPPISSSALLTRWR